MSAQRERVKLTRSEEVRSSNNHIAGQAARFRFVSRVPILCECSDPGCQSIILVDLDRYEELRERGFYTAPAHRIENAEPALREDEFWLQRATHSAAWR